MPATWLAMEPAPAATAPMAALPARPRAPVLAPMPASTEPAATLPLPARVLAPAAMIWPKLAEAAAVKAPAV